MDSLTDLVSFKHSNCNILNKLHATSQNEIESEQRKEVDVRGKVAVKINENED
jgi:hypothetical protein